jgi:hypothetical protein
MGPRGMVADLATAVVAGYAGTKVMEPVSMALPVAALLTGAAMSAVADEALTPLLGFSAPNRAYPAVTHIRGVAAHLVFGAAVGAVTEAVWAITGRRPAACSTTTVRS